ncbi:DNA-directed RNA polymerase subunit beta [Evansella cellulosilytica]|uniref:DNA-directed RNA polymerase subunit beta n=1 Tax=Evansella cellulosilytica (strain ATCC 21833 / DSM 2522 / FERM P-1141 / JCM 9156 / N-4) TaxID=649639 RepID=E6TWK9_EVAC2|nr:DNA-directed RNA polymerase subunit beta [Evansella cellulosilytica]ADU32272.1 hypothetical protein Bcell_4042 [Evansella cellulosilytica DSM 2522]
MNREYVSYRSKTEKKTTVLEEPQGKQGSGEPQSVSDDHNQAFSDADAAPRGDESASDSIGEKRDPSDSKQERDHSNELEELEVESTSSMKNNIDKDKEKDEIEKGVTRSSRRKRMLEEKAAPIIEDQDSELGQSVEDEDEEGVNTRKARRKQKKLAKQEKRDAKFLKRRRIRLIPIWIRLIFVIALFAGSLIAGTMVGFGIVGDGNPRDVLEAETWYNVYDFIFIDTPLDRHNR